MNIEKIRDPRNPFNIIGYKMYAKGETVEGCSIHYTEPYKYDNSLYFDKDLNDEIKVKSIDDFLQMFYKGLFVCLVVDGEVQKTCKAIDVDTVTDDIYPEMSNIKYIRINVGYKDFNDTNNNMNSFNYAIHLINKNQSPIIPN